MISDFSVTSGCAVGGGVDGPAEGGGVLVSGGAGGVGGGEGGGVPP